MLKVLLWHQFSLGSFNIFLLKGKFQHTVHILKVFTRLISLTHPVVPLLLLLLSIWRRPYVLSAAAEAKMPERRQPRSLESWCLLAIGRLFKEACVEALGEEEVASSTSLLECQVN